MQLICSLFLRQWYHTRHESLTLQHLRIYPQQLLSSSVLYQVIAHCVAFLFLNLGCNKY
ncbi:hypothetical protein J500_0291 [Acinetobacter sp. 479375]|nr:hypothetical protein J500_0291 [Acinetobacter sp. 479375]